MLRKIAILLSLVLILGSTFSTSAVAQEGADVDAPEFDGLESGYARMYMPDFSTMSEAGSTPGASTPEVEDEGVVMIMINVLIFDSIDNAEKGFDTAIDATTYDPDAETPLKSSKIDDLGDKAMLYSGEFQPQDHMISISILVVRNAEEVYLLQIVGGDVDAGATQARDIARFMLDAEPTTDEVTLNPDGTSTGSVFDRMPTAEDTDLLGNLVPAMDMDMNAATPGSGS